MKKLIVGLTLAAVVMNPTLSNAHDSSGDVGAVIAGLVIGTVLFNSARHNDNHDRYERVPPPRVVRICEQVPLYDARGFYVRTEVRCHTEVIRD